MGLSTKTIERWATSGAVERDEPWPPFVRAAPGTRVEMVARWNESVKICYALKWVIRLVFLVWGVNLTPQTLEFIGPASCEEAARTACLDETYFSFPMTVDRFLPRESVNLSGVRYWKRRIHKLFWLSEPEGVVSLVLIPESQLKGCLSMDELKELKSDLRRLIDSARLA